MRKFAHFQLSSNATISNNSITVSAMSGGSRAIELSASSPTISNNTIAASTSAAVANATAIRVNASSGPTILHNVITASSTSVSVYGVESYTALLTIARGNTITATSATSTAVGLQNYTNSPSIIEGNSIAATGGGVTQGILNYQTFIIGLTIENNVISGSSTSSSAYGIQHQSGGLATLTNNTISASSTTAAAIALQLAGAGAIIANNIFFTTAGPIGTGNVTVANFAAVNFVSGTNLRLTSSTPASVRTGGLDASLSICGAGGTTSCGSVSIDRDGGVRTTPFSMGAYGY
jgi:hypothetical protein